MTPKYRNFHLHSGLSHFFFKVLSKCSTHQSAKRFDISPPLSKRFNRISVFVMKQFTSLENRSGKTSTSVFVTKQFTPFTNHNSQPPRNFIWRRKFDIGVIFFGLHTPERQNFYVVVPYLPARLHVPSTLL